MEGDLALRLGKKHLLIDFKDIAGNFLYHLEHYPSLTAYKDRNGPATPRQKNEPKIYGLSYQVNGENWGLNQENINLTNYQPNKGFDHSLNNKGCSPQISLSMRFSFYVCNAKRKVDLLRLNLPNFMQTSSSKLRVKIGKLKKLFKLC